MILLYLQANPWKTTTNSLLQDFQKYVVENIDEFISSTPRYDEHWTANTSRERTYDTY